jgi:aryl-alcohol dehydrogenase-like predicted oxidoreductase
MSLEKRRLGRTDLQVTALGFGAWEIGWTDVAAGDEVGRLLNRALDLGIDFIDSSAAYRWSEELIAKYVGHRRREFTYATKCGSWRVQQADGEWVQRLDYSVAAITPQIDRSLQRMGTDTIDIMQLHSPSYDDLVHGDGLEGLKAAQRAGKVRYISLSADDAAAQAAIDLGEFDTLQLTYNALEQGPGGLIEAARALDMGIIVKNPIANGAYLKPVRPDGEQGMWWDRARVVLDSDADPDPVATTLRWLLADERVHSAIVGTTSIDHLEANVAAASQGPLPEDQVTEMNRRYRQATT